MDIRYEPEVWGKEQIPHIDRMTGIRTSGSLECACYHVPPGFTTSAECEPLRGADEHSWLMHRHGTDLCECMGQLPQDLVESAVLLCK